MHHLTPYHPLPDPLIPSAIHPFRRRPPPEKHPCLLVCLSVPQETPNLPADIRNDDCLCNLLDEGRLTGLGGAFRPPLGYTYIRLYTPVTLTLPKMPRCLGFGGLAYPFFHQHPVRTIPDIIRGFKKSHNSLETSHYNFSVVNGISKSIHVLLNSC